MKWANIERHQRLFDYTAGTHFVLKHGYPKKVIQLYDLTRAVAYLNLGNPSPQPSWHLTRWAKSASWHCARHLWWLAENISTWLWSRSHPALAFFSPCTTKDWFILWFAACQRFTGPLSPRYSGMFDMPLLANSRPKYDNHGTIHLGYCNQIATLKQLYLNMFEQKSSHIFKFTTFFSLIKSYHSPRS